MESSFPFDIPKEEAFGGQRFIVKLLDGSLPLVKYCDIFFKIQHQKPMASSLLCDSCHSAFLSYFFRPWLFFSHLPVEFKSPLSVVRKGELGTSLSVSAPKRKIDRLPKCFLRKKACQAQRCPENPDFLPDAMGRRKENGESVDRPFVFLLSKHKENPTNFSELDQKDIWRRFLTSISKRNKKQAQKK